MSPTKVYYIKIEGMEILTSLKEDELADYKANPEFILEYPFRLEQVYDSYGAEKMLIGSVIPNEIVPMLTISERNVIIKHEVKSSYLIENYNKAVRRIATNLGNETTEQEQIMPGESLH